MRYRRCPPLDDNQLLLMEIAHEILKFHLKEQVNASFEFK